MSFYENEYENELLLDYPGIHGPKPSWTEPNLGPNRIKTDLGPDQKQPSFKNLGPDQDQ